MIELRYASLVYPGSERPALDGVSLTVSPGQMVGLLGPNGSGKSTLARLCNGLLVPTAGSVLVDGIATSEDETIWDVRARVGFVQQNPDNQIVGTVVEEDVAFGPENLGVPREELRTRVDAALLAVGLTGFERREPHLLSEGQKQRLAVAGALALQPAYLVLDEPTAMLDTGGRLDVLRAVHELRTTGVGILYVTHYLEDVLDADVLVVLDAGRIAFQGPPTNLLGERGMSESLGLDLPQGVALAAALRARGLPVPVSAVTASEIVGSLWPS